MRNVRRFLPWPMVVWVLFVLFAVVTAMYLHRLPGLFGDEASEGQNVYDLLGSDHAVTILGERSYIGPLIDYVRIPFVGLFGYTALALRAPMWLFSLAAFAVAVPTFRKLFGEPLYLAPLVAIFFSPTYLLYQRLGWAITLFSFFAILVLFAITRSYRPQLPLLAGFIAGLGLHNYVTFFPVIMGIAAPAAVHLLRQPKERRSLLKWWPAVLGLWAGFGTQFGVMNMYQEDQGRPWDIVRSFPERWEALPDVLPRLVSGSAYVASYTGEYVPPQLTLMATALVGIGCILALTLSPRRWIAWLWLAGTAIQISGMLAMVDRFTLRYFALFILAVWALAGFGWGKLLWLLFQKKRARFESGALLAAGLLSSLVIFGVFVPFLRTGGGIHAFPLDHPKSTAELMMDTRPLLACLQGRGPVYSEDIHIMNRLIFFQHEEPALVLTDGKKTAAWLVRHRLPADPPPSPSEACPALRHFIVTRNQKRAAETAPSE